MNSRKHQHLRTCLALLVALFALAFGTAAPVQAAASVKAKDDKATVGPGQTITVAVLNNDRIRKNARARVRIISVATGITAQTAKKRIRVTASATAAPRAYQVTYRVTDHRGNRDTAVLTVTIPTAPSPNQPQPPTPQVPSPQTNLDALIAALPVEPEHTTGYDRDFYKHWTDADSDGCNTRYEVLIAEAVTPPTVGSGCSLTGGAWRSYYDNTTVTDPSTLDIDHMVPLAESWHSGAYAWDADTRMRFANDLDDPRSLVAVTATSNRSKSDRDPAEWLPSHDRCLYITEWVAVKTRWSLTIDPTEKNSLTTIADTCPDTPVVVTKATVNQQPTTPGPNPAPTVTITGVRYDPAATGNPAIAEYVTITNPTATPVTLTGWTLRDAASYSYTFPTFTIAPGASVNVWVPTGTNTSTDLYSGRTSAVWNNSGDTATLTNTEGTTVASCAYTTGTNGYAAC